MPIGLSKPPTKEECPSKNKEKFDVNDGESSMEASNQVQLHASQIKKDMKKNLSIGRHLLYDL